MIIIAMLAAFNCIYRTKEVEVQPYIVGGGELEYIRKN